MILIMLLESSVRLTQHEVCVLEDALKANNGLEYDESVKSLKAEEGVLQSFLL